MKEILINSTIIINKVYDVFNEYINNDPIENPDNYEQAKVNIFSFLNCSSIGRDLNITIFIIKKQLKNNLFNVSIINYIMNFVTIFISILVVFILNLYKTEEEDENIEQHNNRIIINNKETNENDLINKSDFSDKNNELLFRKYQIKKNNSKKLKNENSEENSEINSKADTKSRFLMNKYENNSLNNEITNTINVEISTNKKSILKNSNNNYDNNFEQNYENSKENENLNNNINNDDSF